ncbi:MAG: hypothetical protein E3J41_04235 [Candidatus Cloacimonadota bacterium]|nr:MAG: hypothetical protein E3J41_04235 [Candidatus Cloacimonadota bacterium]
MFIKGNMRNYKKGASLVELMILILIIAILGSVTYPHILGMYARSREASVKSNMFTLRVAAENFASMAEGRYPETGVMTVGDVLINMGFPTAVNPAALADACPGTRANVVGAPPTDALLPGNNTYGNPFWPDANCLDHLAAAVAPGPATPGHLANPAAGADGQGTVYWGPIGLGGTSAMEGYVIYGDGYKEMLTLELRSGQ